MHLVITLDGSESDKHLEKISYAISLLRSNIDIAVLHNGRPLVHPAPVCANDTSAPAEDAAKIAEEIRRVGNRTEGEQANDDVDYAAAESQQATREALEKPIPPLPPKPPVAPTPAAAPTSTSAPTAPAATSGVERDGDGLPWDERIHSSNHKLNAQGKWWAKRNVSPDLVDSVTAELRQLVGNELDPATLFTREELHETPKPPAPTGWTYVALVQKIIEKKFTFQEITAFLLSVGVSPGNLPTLKAAAEKNPALLDNVATVMGIE